MCLYLELIIIKLLDGLQYIRCTKSLQDLVKNSIYTILLLISIAFIKVEKLTWGAKIE